MPGVVGRGGCFLGSFSCRGLKLPRQDPGTALVLAGQRGAFTVPFLWGGGGM